jgi:hypothetical protein
MTNSCQFLCILTTSLVFFACGSPQPEPQATDLQTSRAFLANYAPFCGNVYAGKSTYTNLGENSPLNDADLVVTFESCNEIEVIMPFFVEDDRSRTWILSYNDGGLRLGHDHRYEDGTQHGANFYGGVAMENNGAFEHYPADMNPSAQVLFFPSDARTLADRATRVINVWSKEFDLENELYYYRLYLSGELRFEATFDLSQPISE